MKVSEVLGLKVKYNHEVNSIKTDSRKICKNDIFVCVKGFRNNGFDFIEEAINFKAKTIVSDDDKILEFEKSNYKVNFIKVEDIKISLASYLKKFYNLNDLFLIGITGTNGKTTISTLIYKYFRYLGKNVTLIGTNGIYLNDDYFKSSNTTPQIVDIYYYLNLSRQKNIKTIIMEVSSHGIKECRIKGLNFNVGLLTNITLDHLDYHKTFDDYFYTKLMFLNNCDNLIVNSDMELFEYVQRILKDNLITYGHKSFSNYKITSDTLDIVESSFDITIKDDLKYYIATTLLGEYNISNVCAFISIVDTLDMFNQYTLSFLKKKIVIDGRFETITSKKGTFIIDFAHTPDSVIKILTFINKVKISKLYVVMGMGGDRDKSKRKIVGDIITKNSDYAIITSDNPRTENPLDIINEIVEGIDYENRCKYIIEEDRRKAIELAYKMAFCDDIILVLGKGNEKYQIVGTEYLEYNDKEEVLKCINKKGD